MEVRLSHPFSTQNLAFNVLSSYLGTDIFDDTLSRLILLKGTIATHKAEKKGVDFKVVDHMHDVLESVHVLVVSIRSGHAQLVDMYNELKTKYTEQDQHMVVLTTNLHQVELAATGVSFCIETLNSSLQK